tara:strand:+ start:199 stop:471 length:273 start_codon:yes stop_codon:yes gene_type:complete
MKIYPKNKHLLVELIEEDAEEKSSVLLPIDYQKKQDSVLARVIRVHESLNGEISEGSMIVAEPNMIREISFGGSTYYLLQANYVLCEVKE